MRYLHYRDRGQAAARLADAFRPDSVPLTAGSVPDAAA